MNLGSGIVYRIGDGTVGPLSFLLLTSGVGSRTPPVAASRFFNVSFFSLCSRCMGFGVALKAAAGLSGDGIDGAWLDSRWFVGIAEGMGPCPSGKPSIISSGKVGYTQSRDVQSVVSLARREFCWFGLESRV